ncbi:MAG: SbcC/MukB-like Walker B domain-containing protein, partial [Acidimicrobiia bacterium]
KLDAAEEAARKARTGRDAAQGTHTWATADLAAAHAAVEAAAAVVLTAQEGRTETAAELERATASIVELQEEIATLIPGDDPATEIEERRRVLAESAALIESSQLAEGAAREAVEEARARQGRLDSELVQLATTVATLAGQLGGDLQPGADAAELRLGLVALRDLWEQANASATDDQAAAGKRSSEAAAALADLLVSLDLAADDSVADARRQAATEHGKLAERMEGLTIRIARFEELEAGSAETVARLATYETLAQDLLPARFLKFVLDEERRRLGELGSEHFERMTRGRYRFTADGEFDVADLAAAETERKAESLSGGETFLASLSLALALAEMVSRTGGRLDAFFLDEGFGSLDPEHLDLAMEGIEELVGGNRLVAVVSHVPQLRERVEDLIELDNDPITGDTVVVRP